MINLLTQFWRHLRSAADEKKFLRIIFEMTFRKLMKKTFPISLKAETFSSSAISVNYLPAPDLGLCYLNVLNSSSCFCSLCFDYIFPLFELMQHFFNFKLTLSVSVCLVLASFFAFYCLRLRSRVFSSRIM